MMHLVEVAEIPSAKMIEDVPLDDLMQIYKVCTEMEKICTESNGIGISAVQVGIPWKLFLIKHSKGNTDSSTGFRYYLNCSYEPTIDSEEMASLEGCLSIKDEDGNLTRYLVERHKKVRVKGFRLLDICGLSIEEFDEILDINNFGVVFQHEIDHQNGVLISDIGHKANF